MAAAPHLSSIPNRTSPYTSFQENGAGTPTAAIPASGYVPMQAAAPAAPFTPVRAAANGYATLSGADPLRAPIKALRPPSKLSFDVRSTGVFLEHEGQSTFTFPDGMTLGDFIDYNLHMTKPVLGKGMSGSAYRVDSGGKSFVLKHVTNRDISMETILREIRMLTRVYGKWFAVQLLAAEVHDNGEAFLLFPYIPGKELFDIIEPFTRVKPTADQVVYLKYIFNTLLDGLYNLHKMGIIHRDIKPENIWVPADPAIPPFFLDFGLSATTEKAIRTAGTVSYIRPDRVTMTRVPSENDNYYAVSIMAQYFPHIFDPVQAAQLSRTGLTRNAARHIRFRGGKRHRTFKNK